MGAQRSEVRAEVSPAEDDLALEHQLCFALTVAARSVVGAYRPVLEQLGLTHPQYLAMLALWQRSPRSLKELSDELAHEPATLSVLLNRLQERGLVTRTRSDGDRRSILVDLTDEGARMRERAVAIPGIMLERLGLDRAGLEELNSRMRGLIDAAEQASHRPAPTI